MFRTYVIKLYPNKAQTELLEKHFGCCRWVYNEMIQINNKVYHRTGKSVSGYDMQRYLPKLKKQYPWLSEISSQALQIVCHNLAKAYIKFFKKQGGHPVLKKKGQGESFACVTGVQLDDHYIILPKLGRIRYRGGDCLEGKMKRFTISKQSYKYYVSILIDTPEIEPVPNEPETMLGIDLGLIDVVVTSEGDRIPAPKLMRKYQTDIKQAQQKLSKCQRNSKNRKKAKLRVGTMHQQLSNKRRDFNHKLSKMLVSKDKNQAFAVEDLNIKGMMSNHRLAKAIADVGWYQFLTFLKYKATAVGKQVLTVDRFYSSTKTCSVCGSVQQSLPLSVREWQCNDCGSVHQRDVNAAINIALEASRNYVSDRGDGVKPLVLVPVYETRNST